MGAIIASIDFYAGEDFLIPNTSGSGLGFYGDSGFGASVLVSTFQGRTFITSSAGTSQGAEVDNVKYLNVGSGIIGQAGSGTHIKAIPNYLATVNIRFTHASAIKVQNAKMRMYDRSNINNVPSGVTVRAAELIHPGITQVAEGSGDNVWIGTTNNPQTGLPSVGGSGLYVDLANSPGVSGLHAGNGSDSLRTDTRHDWFCCLSASPDSVGSKSQFALYVELEYL
jgi:hypothetical protein